jgi:ATP-dependent Clp protease ATP-binding subunit ClpA
MSGTIRLDPDRSSELAIKLKRFLESKIVDQRRAIDRIILSYEYWLSPVWQPERPILTALFLGPSGVGKTRIAEALAEFFFEDRFALTKVECSNFKERHELAKLIGSPPGYVGYNEPPLFSQDSIDGPALEYGMKKVGERDLQAKKLYSEIEELKERINRAPSGEKKGLQDELGRRYASYYVYLNAVIRAKRIISVILFDEFEKGHEALRHFLLEIASKGRTRLGNGEETVFYNSFIILTSNVASRIIADTLKNRGIVGFSSGGAGGLTDSHKERLVYEYAVKELKKYVEPEFLGRIEKDTVVFKSLSNEDLAEIRDREISEFIDHLAATYPIKIVISADARNFILKQALDHPEYGARLIVDKVDKYLKSPLARMINSGQIKEADRIFVGLENKEIVFSKKGELAPLT